MTWRVKIRYKEDKEGIQRCATGRELRLAVTSIATQGKAFAEATSPSGFEGYQYQFEVDTEVVPDIPFRKRGEPMERVSAFLVNQSRLAVLVEVGSKIGGPGRGTVENYRILGRTLHWIDMQGRAR